MARDTAKPLFSRATSINATSELDSGFVLEKASKMFSGAVLNDACLASSDVPKNGRRISIVGFKSSVAKDVELKSLHTQVPVLHTENRGMPYCRVRNDWLK